jgi:subfamily B ATP-binding cassette protein MsbA
LARENGLFATVNRLLPYLKRYWKKAAMVVVLGATAAIGSKANIALLKPLVNLLFPVSTERETVELSILDRFDAWLSIRLEGLDFFGWGEHASSILLLCWALIISALVFASIQYVFVRLSRMLGVWLITDLRQDLAEHVLRLDMSFHSKRRLGDLLSRMTSDVGTSLRILLLIVEEIIQEPFNILAAFFMAWIAAPQATLGMLVFVPILAWPVIKLGPKIRKRSAQSQARLGDTTQSLTQMFSGIRVVKAFRMEEREAEEFRKANQSFVKQTERMVRTQAFSLAVTNFLSHGGVGILIAVIALVNVWHPLFRDAGSMTAFFAAIAIMFNGIKRLTKALSIVYTSMGATERVFEVFDLKPALANSPSPLSFNGLEKDVAFESVAFKYGSGEPQALAELNFSVPRGSTLALVGASGAGKTTLLDLVARFYDPTSGKVLVDGKDLKEVCLSDWLDRIAVVSQSPFLFQTSLRENIRYGRPGSTDKEVEDACDAANLGDFLHTLSNGLDTEVGEGGARLSGGQAQRVTIARAILKNPDVLLLDEATSALDSESERRVQAALENLMAGRTTFAIAHRLSTIRSADRILVLADGKVIEDGTHESLVAQGGHYAHLWGLQA